MSEYRSTPRVDCDIMLNKVHNGQRHVCRAVNISLGGIRLRRLLEPTNKDESRVRLQIQLPGSDSPIWIAAERVYEDEDFIGLRFMNISHQHFVTLRSWLQSNEGLLEQAA